MALTDRNLKIRNDVYYLVMKFEGKLYRESTKIRVGGRKEFDQAKRRATDIEGLIRAHKWGWKKKVPTVKQYWENDYKPAYTAGKAAKTQKLDQYYMTPLLKAFGDRPLDAVTPTDYAKYLKARRKTFTRHTKRKQPMPLSENTIQRERAFHRAFFRRAVEDKHIEDNPVQEKAIPFTARHRLLTDENQPKLLARLSPQFQRFVLFLLGTGIRLEECRTIDPTDDLHLDERWMKVTGKGNKERAVPIPVELVPIIDEQLAQEGGLWRQKPNRLRTVLLRACNQCPDRTTKQSPLPRLSPHDLRHTFGHRFLANGGDIYKLSKILGHADLKVTQTHYAYLLKEDLREALDKIDLGLGLPRAKRGKALVGRFGTTD